MTDNPHNPDSAAAPEPSPARRRSRRTLLIAGIVVAVLIVIAAALVGGSYWWFSSKVHEANARLDPGTKEALATPPPTTLVSVPPIPASPDPHKPPPVIDIVLFGSDKKPGMPTDYLGKSDVIILLHIDREQNFLSMLRVPRDLYVDIPGYYKDRINEAYKLGGTPLAITTIKNVLGVDVTKSVEVGFATFEDMIDSIGGVYVDVDRRYDTYSLWVGDGLDPGYQLLDGVKALSFARYRFDQNKDFGRMARQQRILAAVRDQAVNWNLPIKLPGLVSILLGSAKTNLGTNDLLDLARWLVRLDGSRIKQTLIQGPSVGRDGKAVVVVDRDTLAKAVAEFYAPPDESSARTDESLPAAAGYVDLLAAASAPTSGNILDARMWTLAQKSVPFPLEAPRSIPAGFRFTSKWPEQEGTYGIEVGGGTKPAVRMMYRYRNSDLYLGITATTWADAPIAGSGEAIESNGVTYTVVGTSGKVDHIWWKKNGVLYFISNTLMFTASREDLLRMAESMTPVTGTSP
jgi:polyisoprenyl-teichoic acid--peptidoglycan teichoic acid transferase